MSILKQQVSQLGFHLLVERIQNTNVYHKDAFPELYNLAKSYGYHLVSNFHSNMY